MKVQQLKIVMINQSQAFLPLAKGDQLQILRFYFHTWKMNPFKEE